MEHLIDNITNSESARLSIHWLNHPTIKTFIKPFLKNEDDEMEKERLLKWVCLFGIQTLQANYPALRDIEKLEDLVYEQEGTKLFNPVALRDAVNNANVIKKTAPKTKKESEKPTGRDTLLTTFKSQLKNKDENKTPNKTKISKPTTKAVSKGKTKGLTPIFGDYPSWWGHEEHSGKGMTQTELLRRKREVLKAKDRKAYYDSLRRELVRENDDEFFGTISEPEIPRLKQKEKEKIHVEKASSYFVPVNKSAKNQKNFFDRISKMDDDGEDPISIAETFLKKTTFLSCLDES
jgi:hypothetical protein